MVMKILGAIDLIIGICFIIFFKFGFFPKNFILFLGIFLLIKGGIFSIEPNFGSTLDIISAFIIIGCVYFKIPFFLAIFVFAFLLQKALFSFFSE